MSKFYKTNEFKNLEREWYLRLQKEGFKDAEDTTKDHRPLNEWHSFRFAAKSQLRLESAKDYYARAKDLLELYPFKSEMHRWIWELHSKGLSKRKIEVLTRGHKDSIKREWIGHLIKIIAKEIK